MRRVGEEQECPGGKRRVEDVHADAAENLLADDHSEGDAHGDREERNRRRQYEREESWGDEETFIDLMPPDYREYGFDVSADGQRHDIHGKVVKGAVNDAREDPGSQKLQPQKLEDRRLPVVERRGAGLNGQVRLIAGVVHGHEHAAAQGDDDRNH